MSGGSQGWLFSLVLLGALTLGSLGGPLLILVVVMGGASGGWPPDRPVEWIVAVGVVVVEILLLAGCLTVGWWGRPFLARSRPRDSARGPSGGPAATP